MASHAAQEGGVGALGGAVLGPVFHGASKAVGAVANRTLPGLREIREVAKAPELQGARDVIRHADYDGVNFGRLSQDLAIKPPAGMAQAEADAIAARVAAGESPSTIAGATGHGLGPITEIAGQERAIRAKFNDMNLLEAAKASDLRALPHTGELRPEVTSTRNLDQLARWAANTEGRGQNEAAHAFAARKDEMGALLQRDIDQAFKSGGRAADEETMAIRKAALGKRYDKLRDTAPTIELSSMAGLEQHPVMKKALNEAALNDLVRNPGEGMHRWMKPDGSFAADGLQTMTPQNLLDIHHALVMNSKSAFSDPAEARMAGLLKQHFTKFVDETYAKHGPLRKDFAQFKRVMEASEHGAALADIGRTVPPEAISALRNAQQAEASALARAQARQTALEQAQQSGTNARTQSALKGQVTKARNEAAPHSELLDEIRKSFGASLNEQIARSPIPNTVMTKMLTQTGKARILQLLGPEDGQRFIQSLYNKRLQQDLGNKLYGGSDTAFKMQKNQTMDALSNAAMGVLHLRPTAVLQGLGDLASSAYRQQRADAVNGLMTKQGVDELRRLTAAIEARQRLQGTAHGVVRNPALLAIPAANNSTGANR